MSTDVEQHDDAPVSLWCEGHPGMSAWLVAEVVGRVHPAPRPDKPAHAVACAGKYAVFLPRPRLHHLGNTSRREDHAAVIAAPALVHDEIAAHVLGCGDDAARRNCAAV